MMSLYDSHFSWWISTIVLYVYTHISIDTDRSVAIGFAIWRCSFTRSLASSSADRTVSAGEGLFLLPNKKGLNKMLVEE